MRVVIKKGEAIIVFDPENSTRQVGVSGESEVEVRRFGESEWLVVSEGPHKGLGLPRRSWENQGAKIIASTNQKPAWMRQLSEKGSNLLSALPHRGKRNNRPGS